MLEKKLWKLGVGTFSLLCAMTLSFGLLSLFSLQEKPVYAQTIAFEEDRVEVNIGSALFLDLRNKLLIYPDTCNRFEIEYNGIDSISSLDLFGRFYFDKLGATTVRARAEIAPNKFIFAEYQVEVVEHKIYPQGIGFVHTAVALSSNDANNIIVNPLNISGNTNVVPEFTYDKEIISLDIATGKITALSAGTTVLKAKMLKNFDSYFEAECVVTVVERMYAEGINLDSKISLRYGETLNLYLGSLENWHFDLNRTDLIDITDGKLRALFVGKTAVTVTAITGYDFETEKYNTATKEIEIEVLPAVDLLLITPIVFDKHGNFTPLFETGGIYNLYFLGGGAEDRLEAHSVYISDFCYLYWENANEKLRIDAQCEGNIELTEDDEYGLKIIALGEGGAKVMLKALDGSGVFLELEFVIAKYLPHSVNFASPQNRLQIGDSVCLAPASVEPAYSFTEFTYQIISASGSGLAQLSTNGILTALCEGTVKVRVSFAHFYKEYTFVIGTSAASISPGSNYIVLDDYFLLIYSVLNFDGTPATDQRITLLWFDGEGNKIAQSAKIYISIVSGKISIASLGLNSGETLYLKLISFDGDIESEMIIIISQ